MSAIRCKYSANEGTICLHDDNRFKKCSGYLNCQVLGYSQKIESLLPLERRVFIRNADGTGTKLNRLSGRVEYTMTIEFGTHGFFTYPQKGEYFA